jgi:hypothetical protein
MIFSGTRNAADNNDSDCDDSHEQDEDAQLAAVLVLSGGGQYQGDGSLDAQVLAARCLANFMEARVLPTLRCTAGIKLLLQCASGTFPDDLWCVAHYPQLPWLFRSVPSRVCLFPHYSRHQLVLSIMHSWTCCSIQATVHLPEVKEGGDQDLDDDDDEDI